MPIYEFACRAESCGSEEVLEKLQRVSADSPKCGDCDAPMQKLVSRSSFQLKGTGWESDGYSGGRSTDEAMSAVNKICK